MVLSVRSNNPGNLRPVGSSSGFQSFSSPEEGLKAMRDDLLIKVGGKSKAMGGKEPTLANLISTWAPPSENDTGNYINFVSQKTGFSPDKLLTPEDVDYLIPAMVEMEGGQEALNHFSGGGEQTINMAQQEPSFKEIELPDGSIAEFPSDMPDAEIAAVLQKQFPQQTEQTGIIDRSAADIQNRGNKISEYMQAYNKGEQNLPQAAYNAYTQGAGLMSDLGGEILSSVTPDFVKQGAKNALSALGSIPLGGGENTVGSMASSALQKYGDFAQRNPEAADLIGNTLNLGSVLTGTTSNPVTRGAGSALAKVGEGTAAAGNLAKKGAQYAITPTVAPEIAPLVQRAQDMGFKLRLDQVSPTRARKTVQKISQEIPFSGVDANDAHNLSVFNRNAAKAIGQDASNLGPETIKNFLSDASSKFDSALKGEIIPVTPGDVGRLDEILADADLTMTGDLKEIVAKNIQKFKDDASLNFAKDYTGGNTIPGEKLASFRSQLLKRIPKAPAESKQALGEIVDTIDGMLEKNLSPEKQEILTQARREWRNYKTLEPLLEKSTDGMIDPPRLLQRVASSPYIKASRTSVGEDDLVDLARIGNELLTKPGGSDTFQKMALGGAGAATIMNPVTGLKALGGMAGNRAFQSLYNQSPALVEMAAKKGAGSPVFLENQSALQKLIRKNSGK